MPKNKRNLWEQWEEEIKVVNNCVKLSPSDTKVLEWKHNSMFIFLQELSKNVLNENESFDSILDRIIEAIQIGYDFKRVRVYLVTEEDRDKKKLYLYKTSKGHWPIIRNFVLEMDAEKDDAVRTLIVDKKPLAVDDAAKLKLPGIEDLKIKGPYAAIPLLVENKPYALICADTAVIPSEGTPKFSYPESKEYFHTFARAIMAAIENREMFEQRNRNIKQFEMVKKLNELIAAETYKKRLLNSFMKFCVKSLNANGGHLKLFNKKKKRLEAVAKYGVDVAPLYIIRSKPETLSFSKIVFESKKAILINDLTSHPLMIKNIKYYEKGDYKEYLKILKKRKSSLIVPLIKHTGEIYGVLSLHRRSKKQFTEIDKGNLLALASSVTYALDKTQQLEQRDEFLAMKDLLLKMFKEAFGKADCYECVLNIIRQHCRRLLRGKKPKTVCLAFKDLNTGELVEPSLRCFQGKKDCDLCLELKKIVKEALKKGKDRSHKNEMAFPIRQEKEVIGVIYIEGKNKIDLTENEKEILAIISSTAAIIANTSKNYEKKIKQSTAFYEAGQLSTKAGDFREWFNPVMEKVLDIIGRENRNFHLVLVEEIDNEKKLFVRATSPLFIDKKPVPVDPRLLGLELRMDSSLSGEVVKTKKSQRIDDVEKNKVLNDIDNDTRKIPYHLFDKRIKSEVGIPLKIKEGDTDKVIGVLIIDSVVPNDFKDFDMQFHEIIANYLAIIIHNQQLYLERAKVQEELYRLDRSLALQAFIKSFIHDITAPVQEIQSQVNIMGIDGEANWMENLGKLEDLTGKLISSYGEFVKDFTSPFNNPVTMPIRDIITKSLDNVRKTRGLSIPVSGNFCDTNLRIECYSVFVEMAFRSIINNAISYSEDLGQSNKYLKIDVNYNSENDSFSISFESSTIQKIPPDKLEEIFKPFVRFIDKPGGQGLGLSLASLCIKLHNGKIWAENVKGKSVVRFMITIPGTLTIKKEI